MTRLRLTIAKRLKEAQENAAMLTTFNEVDMSEVMKMRSQYKEDFQNEYGVKLGFMSFFVKACVIGLKNYPAVNAEIQGDEIVYKNYYNISIAVGTDRGLVVPVLRETDEMSFADIEKNIGELGQKARDGKITIEDLQGGTFTITNGGIYGSMLSTPILNPPQSAVLGMHNIIQRPVVVEGNIEVRPIMYLALSYDHRIIDGKEAVSFKNCERIFRTTKKTFPKYLIMDDNFDLVVIGGGPGGYVCAIRAAQLGLKTACVESRGALGGTCLNVGCIPSKSLLNLSENFHKAKKDFNQQGIEIEGIKLNIEKMMSNKNKSIQVLTKGVEFLFKKNKVTYYKGKGVLFSKNDIVVYENNNKRTNLKSKNIVIATGSTVTSLPGVEINEKNIVSSTGALSFDKVPSKLAIIGGGYIGLEMGSVWSRLGSEVTVIEYLDFITPGMDREISMNSKNIIKAGIKFKMGSKVESVEDQGKTVLISYTNVKNSKKKF